MNVELSKRESAYTLPERVPLQMLLFHAEHEAPTFLGINAFPVLCDISAEYNFSALCLFNILHTNTSFPLCVSTTLSTRSVSAPLNADTKKPKGVGQWALSRKETLIWHLAECRKECVSTRNVERCKVRN